MSINQILSWRPTAIMLFLLFPLLLTAEATKQQMKDCVRPWQSPLMSIATILAPSRPLECRPEAPAACSQGRNPVCQFSLRHYKYICCKDSTDQPPPLCPKHHDSLQLVCGNGQSHDSSCPKNYRCLPSRTNQELRLCCRPNSNVTHPEPDTTFRENRIVPQVLPYSPLNPLDITFKNVTLIMGQLLDSSKLPLLEKAPFVSSSVLQEDKQYLILLVDSTAKKLVWLASGLTPIDGRLEVNKGTKINLMYTSPSADSDEGIHVMVLVVYELEKPWKSPKIAQDDFTFTEFQQNNPVSIPPIAGSFYAYITTEDERF